MYLHYPATPGCDFVKFLRKYFDHKAAEVMDRGFVSH